jgi:hypothetical protein
MLQIGPLDLPPAWWTDWNHRIEDERCGGWLPALHAYVAKAIARLCLAGNDQPTVAQIAAEAGCHQRTVRRARAKMRERGLLETDPTFPIIDSRPQQRASVNRLLLPDGPVTPKPRLVRGGQAGRPSSDKEVRKPAHEQEIRFVETLAAIARRRMVALGLAR